MINNHSGGKGLKPHSEIYCDICNKEITYEKFYDVFIDLMSKNNPPGTAEPVFINNKEPQRMQFCQKCYMDKYNFGI